MTCIVGLRDGGKVYIGGDSAGVDGLGLMQVKLALEAAESNSAGVRAPFVVLSTESV